MVTVVRNPRGVTEFPQTNVPLIPNPRTTALAILTPVDNPEGEVRLDMLGAAVSDVPQPRWTEVDRPRRQNVLRYDGKGVRRQVFSVIFSGDPDRSTGELGDVTARVDALTRLLGLRGGDEPPILRVAGPLYNVGPDDRWQLESLTMEGEPWRRTTDQRVCQVVYTVSLAQFLYTDTLVRAIIPPSPAAASNERAAEGTGAATGGSAAASTGGGTYTVRKGDNLSKIAAAKLGNASRWREIATLNALRDPNLIFPGQVLKLP